MEKLKVACIGLGGFARNYLNAVTKLSQQERVQVVAVSDVKADLCENAAELLAKDRPQIFSDYNAMLRDVKDIDFVTIGTGIYLHHPMLMDALNAGCHAVMAKPSTVAIQYIDEMIAAAEKYGRTVAIDFQHVYSGGPQFIKQAIVDGRLGKVHDIVIKALWLRRDEYHTRNNWSSRLTMGDAYVLDGPLNNPHAHYINNALYFAGSSGAYESSREIYRISEAYTTVSETGGKSFVSLNEIEQIMHDAAEQKKLYSECGVPWARETEPFSLKDYTEFTLFRE